MSSLHKQIIRPKFPLPPLSGGPARKQQIKRRDYTPVKWDKYFESYQEVEVSTKDVFRVYRKGNSGPLLLLLHGGGYSGLTWATLTQSICTLVECQVAAVDLRGHGESFTSEDDDLSANTLASDVGNIVQKLFEDSPPPIIMIGHSMGGAIAVHAAFQELVPSLIGLAVIDVVEGTAMDALQSMQTFLRSRPASFKNLEAAIEWCVRSGQVRNFDSARVSMPGQIKNYLTNKPATTELEEDDFQSTSSSNIHQAPAPLIIQRGNSIPEEQEEEEQNELEEKKDEEKDALDQLVSRSADANDVKESASSNASTTDSLFAHPSEMAMRTNYSWRIDLSKTEKYWSGWFQGLSAMFLSCNVPKLLLLAGVDRLDRELTIGQMQGKFQMQVLPQCGHAVHEDVPDKVAELLASFMVRHKFVQPTGNFQPIFPGC